MCDHEKASHSVADCGMTQHCTDVFVAESCARICLWRPQFSLFYYYNRILIEIQLYADISRSFETLRTFPESHIVTFAV